MVKKVIVTVRFAANHIENDIELPVDIPALQLRDTLLEEVCHISKSDFNQYVLRVDWPKTAFNLDETLADAGVWDGSILSIHRV